MSLLLTNACEYAGPGSVTVLRREHPRLYCHDRSFSDPKVARRFERDHPGTVALLAQSPSDLIAELDKQGAVIQTVIHNDVHPNEPLPIEAIPLQTFVSSFAALTLFPVELTQQFLPRMKAERSGRFVFVTSARYLQPEPGFAVATSIRAATTVFAQALAHEVAAHGIQVNVVAPNYLYSETYYPRARFIDDPAGRAQIAATVPMGRLGQPEEIGELIAFLVSGKAAFVSGQVIPFTGAWP